MPAARSGASRNAAIVAALPAHTSAFRSDHAPVGMRGFVEAIVQLAPLAPTVGVVVSHDIQQAQKLYRRRFRFGRNLVTASRNRASGVFPMEDGEQFPQNLHAMLTE